MALIGTPPIPDNALNNEQVHRALGLRVAREVLGATDDARLVEIGSLSSNYYSFTFSVKAHTSAGPRDVFVKIPKVDMRGLEASILPITSADREMMLEEEASLKLLGLTWQSDDLEVNWANICGTIPEYNAIVTDRIFADEAFSVFRRFDLRRRLGFRQDAQRLQHSMARLGAALGRFHQSSTGSTVFQLTEALPKFEFYCRKLAAFTSSAWPERILESLRSMGDLQLGSSEVQTLKGIDIRNVLIDAQDKLYLLDPGRMKYTHREADLARFVMTYRILYWGSKRLLLLRAPDARAESTFLEAYYSNNKPPCPRLLSLFLLKEQLKHWYTALDSLQRLDWSPVLKRVVAAVYVDPFYSRQVAAQLPSLMESNK